MLWGYYLSHKSLQLQPKVAGTDSTGEPRLDPDLVFKD